MCTGIRLIADNGAVIYARTLEFAQEIGSNIVLIPRNYRFTSAVKPLNRSPMQWQAHYAVVGANACNEIELVDGVNEKGLAGGLFYFTDYAQFQTVSQDQMAHAIAPWQLMSWLLTTCASVADVKKQLPIIKVAQIVFEPWQIVPPLHAIVHDAQGNSLVIEYVKGELIMRDNPLGTFANAPTFDWHMINLQNYLNLSAANIDKKQVGKLVLTPESQGSGMLGLPGDFTSPSRFVRAAAVSQSVVGLKNEDDARRAAFHILNLFDIPIGVVREKTNGNICYDYTQWTSAADLKNKRYYIHTYNNRQVYMVDLMKMNLDASEPIIIPMQHQEHIIACN